MTEKIELRVGNPPKLKLKMGQFQPPLKIFLFLKVRFINFFLIPVAQTYFAMQNVQKQLKTL